MTDNNAFLSIVNKKHQKQPQSFDIFIQLRKNEPGKENLQKHANFIKFQAIRKRYVQGNNNAILQNGYCKNEVE